MSNRTPENPSVHEQGVEHFALSLFKQQGFKLRHGPELGPNAPQAERAEMSDIVLALTLRKAVEKLNPHLPATNIDAVAASISRPPHPTLIENNRWFHGLLTDGVPIEYKDKKSGEMRGGRARVIDFDNPTNNDFVVVQQLTIQGPSGKTIRPDLILFVNGLPLVVIELKDPADASATLDTAIDQFGRYKETAPDLFVPNLLLVVSDGLLTRVGRITSGRQRFTPWRPEKGGEPTLEALIRELLNPPALLDYLQHCAAFEEDDRGNVVKKVAGYHQFRAVRKTRASVIAAVKRGAKRGTGFQPVMGLVATDQAVMAEAHRLEAGATGIVIRQGANLPHWTREGGIYAVTFRLADSLPQAVVLTWKQEREEILNRAREMNRPLSPAEERQLQHLFSENVEKFLDAGAGHCWLRRPEIAELVANALAHFEGERYRLLAWCVMPNHVHVVVKPQPGHTLAEITHSWKSFTSNEANRRLARTGEFWQKESYDHLIRDEEDLEHAVTYVLNNPRAAGLDAWKWVGAAADIGAIIEDRGGSQRQDAAATSYGDAVMGQDAVVASYGGGVTEEQRQDAVATGQGGVVWHTQGSGKSLTMLMLAGALVRAAEMTNPTLVVVTDRNDLDDQLFDTFAMGRDLLRQEPVQAASRDHLKNLLDRASGGVVFTTIHKFTESHGTISERSNVVVMADEAHRSQYGFVDGGAKWMRDALPNATFVGFTGTPLMAGDKVTRHVFGEYADVYDIRQAVADGATVPIYYEPRIVKLTIDEAGARKAEAAIAEAAKADEAGEEAAENIRIPIEELYGAPERLKRVAKFLVEHWEQRRSAMEGKAIVVTISREIAMTLHDEIVKLRPGWHDDEDDRGSVKVIMTEGLPTKRHNEKDDAYKKRIEPLIVPIEKHGRTKSRRKSLALRFKNPADDFRVAIVVDMWLTGFDVPCAHTMYLDKPLAGHNLMQAIARVNRVYGEKPGGLIVDLIGLADPLADALAMYANATGKTDKPIRELQDEAIPAMRSAFEQLCGFFHGYDYAAALDAEPINVLKVYLGAIDHVLDVGQNVGEETGWKRFRGMLKRLSTAFALAVPREETKAITPHLTFFQRIGAMIRKRLAEDTGPTPGGGESRDIDAAVRQVIGDAVEAGDVIDLFAATGLDAARLDILSEDFLNRVSALEQKNLALETLRKLLTDQIKISERTNLVQAQKFREALEKAMLGYTNKQITTAEMIAKLLELAKWVREAKLQGQELGLSTEEVAFYDALAENGSAKEVMQSDQLRLMARELAEMVKKMPKLDWTQRESVRADLRRKVRRLLAMYGYPPDLSEDATQLVLRQAELSTESSA
ncbi:HsdR family type I site-specific deoxyribonuclease [Schlesneria sp. DSM 10557]|uniref:HsdR family type I site-specific deoxyribonuclease n=1 Tax=Schlesneria sp. DSM 10557 TaxID=3044399 RepID=UPI0035A0539B